MAGDRQQGGSKDNSAEQVLQIKADALLVNTDPKAAAERFVQDAIMLQNDNERTRQAVIEEMRNYSKGSAVGELPSVWINVGSPYGPSDPSHQDTVTIGAQTAFGTRPDGLPMSASGDSFGHMGISAPQDVLTQYPKRESVHDVEPNRIKGQQL